MLEPPRPRCRAVPVKIFRCLHPRWERRPLQCFGNARTKETKKRPRFGERDLP